jgi:hypothetical protein
MHNSHEIKIKSMLFDVERHPSYHETNRNPLQVTQNLCFTCIQYLQEKFRLVQITKNKFSYFTQVNEPFIKRV